LAELVTDVWVTPSSPLSRIPSSFGNRLAGRFHPELDSLPVKSFDRRFLAYDLGQRLYSRHCHSYHAGRNELFDRLTSKRLAAVGSERGVLFSYSYSCRDTLRAAKALGCATVLGQFDPGPVEAAIVEMECLNRPEFRAPPPRYPENYFDRWREEIAAADRILVNSPWSARCLASAGIPSDRVRIVPLVYQTRTVPPRRAYPQSFSRVRPLRVLFLGQVILRKGIARLLDAARELGSVPIEFSLVGPSDISNLSQLLSRHANVRWLGAVPRAEVERYYLEADVFILPTLSDGFALTQLEALARGLPVIATGRCGEAVRHLENGLLLTEPSPGAITEVLLRCFGEPAMLEQFSRRANGDGFEIERLTRELAAIEHEIKGAT
jgi:glycosyltransferase involved in cell wall biosynthesis